MSTALEQWRRDIALRREVKELRRLTVKLARALYKHTRTDIAPDAALPAMRRIVRDLTRKR